MIIALQINDVHVWVTYVGNFLLKVKLLKLFSVAESISISRSWYQLLWTIILTTYTLSFDIIWTGIF